LGASPVAPDALISAAVSLATNRALRDRLRSQARQPLVEQSWDRVIDRFEADLASVVKSAPRPPVPDNERRVSQATP